MTSAHQANTIAHIHNGKPPTKHRQSSTSSSRPVYYTILPVPGLKVPVRMCIFRRHRGAIISLLIIFAHNQRTHVAQPYRTVGTWNCWARVASSCGMHRRKRQCAARALRVCRYSAVRGNRRFVCVLVCLCMMHTRTTIMMMMAMEKGNVEWVFG